ncbi:phage tail protein [Polaribacter vadi]|uniref:tail fiber protein n=1 Tax=Polaribacter TaxID=52959 RepID=UPI001C0953DE|nr:MULTISPECIES: tail fiber protein [Polaribacter]MBU3010177.1 phage tail protein [Polaribacter vadi]MDO6739984.1 phage tail protein [Polaribacter sp. 1_MG-2023]
MKKVYSTLLFLFLTSISFAQGIAVQGIARDATGAALTDQNLTFTFIISEGSDAPLFEETQVIKTDLFGVFSHIVGNGNASGATFNSIDFSLDNLTLKISVAPNGNNIEIYNKPFQYTPYAHYAKRAENGVPTGAIMPFLGENAPKGWVLCDGLNISSIPDSQALRTLLGSENSPNLNGRFLKGVGTPAESNVDAIGLKATQNQQTRLNQHTHAAGSNLNTDSKGAHSHTTKIWKDKATTYAGVGLVELSTEGDGGTEYYTSVANGNDGSDNKSTTSGGGSHSHTVTGTTGNTTATTLEVRPSSYGVNYIIKL